MSGEVTARDRVWTAMLNTQPGRFTVSDVRRRIRQDLDDHQGVPNDETIRRVLRAATELGVLDHTDGSKYYRKEPYLRKRFEITTP